MRDRDPKVDDAEGRRRSAIDINTQRPLVPQLESMGIELDQRLATALRQAAANKHWGDDTIVRALMRQNAVPSQYFDLSVEEDRNGVSFHPARFEENAPVPLAEVQLGLRDILRSIINLAVGTRREARTLGVGDFVRGVLQINRLHTAYFSRPYTVDYLCAAIGAPVTASLLEAPRAQRLLDDLEASTNGSDDYQFAIFLRRDRLFFRPVSVLGDYSIARGHAGQGVVQRAVLTHLRNAFGVFTEDEVGELEELINSPRPKERDFQAFFERHPHFFRQWDYREIHSQVHLATPEGDLIPDFILTDQALQKAAIVDLKLPKPRLIRRQKNRERFSSAIEEARAQLLTYRDWFRESANRKRLAEQVGIEVYEPHLAAIVGRSSDFTAPIDRQRLRSRSTDIEIVTYDDVLAYARRRLLFMSGER